MFLAALVLAIAATTGTCAEVPLFARFAAEAPELRAYTVPLETAVAVHKLLTFHVRLSGSVSYDGPGGVTLRMDRVPAEDRALFAHIGSPRTWPRDYQLQLLGTSTANGQAIYHIAGTPRESSSGVERFVADVNEDGSLIASQWFLRGGGTIKSTLENQIVGGFILPKHQLADIDVGGYKIHADMTYGQYLLNDAAVTAQR